MKKTSKSKSRTSSAAEKKKVIETVNAATATVTSAATSMLKKNPQVFQLNLSLKYINDLKQLLPSSMPVDNYRTPMIQQEDQQCAFFFAKMAYRYAGHTDDYENEQAKKKFMSLMCKIADLRMESSSTEGMKLLDTAEEVMQACCAKINPHGWLVSFATNTDLFLSTMRNNMILLNFENAQQLQILLSLWQNSLDSIISSQLTAANKAKHMGNHMRLYFFYQQLVDNALQSIAEANVQLNPGLKANPFCKPVERDMQTASQLCLPMIIPSLMYNFNLLRRLVDSHYDFRDCKEQVTKLALAPFILPASCKMDGMFPIYNQQSLTVSFEMERLLEAKRSLFDFVDDFELESTDSEEEKEEEEGEEGKGECKSRQKIHLFGKITSASKSKFDNYRYTVTGKESDSHLSSREKKKDIKYGLTDARMFNMLKSKVEPFHLFTPRKFLCAQVLTFMMAMNSSMWFLAVAHKSTYCQIEEIQFALQMLHPVVGLNTHVCNHVLILQSFLSCILQIVYEKNEKEEENASCHSARLQRAEKLQDLVNELAYIVTLPTIRSSTAGGPRSIDKETEEDLNQTNPFDRLLPVYEEVLLDFLPFVKEYFSIPNLFENHRKLSIPALASYDTYGIALQLWIDPDNTRQFDYQAAEPCPERVDELVQSWMKIMSSFPAKDIEQFVNMQKYSL